MSDDDFDDFDDLDDVLDDFDNEILSQAPGATIQNDIAKNSNSIISDNVTGSTSGGGATADEIISATDNVTATDNPNTGAGAGTNADTDDKDIDFSKDLESNFKELLDEIQVTDPELKNNLANFLNELNGKGDLSKYSDLLNGGVGTNAETGTSANTDSKNPESSSAPAPDFKNVISETMSRIKTSGDKVDKQIKEEQPDELLSQLLNSLDLGDLNLSENGENGGDLSNILSDMLLQLSSKKVLYEPLNDLNSKFPTWIENNLNDSNIESYQNQYAIVNSIINKFNDENYDDSNAEDKKFITEKLDELQELGMPPKELMNDDLSLLPGFNNGIGSDVGLSEADLPEDVGKELEENCKQT
ncbi:unnamed protein product [[Candida] boidinii]|uniref:Unnamed protein product n=1 Tax=Candida boidinii TaxID=5477 RepID=A0A9W6WGE1_CANBO|nr:hypothetical protein B5S30_g4971 [[Candida] boidinii]OWB86941.1 hypothetical protein B5S33_g5668 [[Candida] boidinii]GME70877.1 unnamed protein product [[Candida] boidinii]